MDVYTRKKKKRRRAKGFITNLSSIAITSTYEKKNKQNEKKGST